MYSKFQLAKKYIKFYLTASNGQGHGIHSPFVFDFIKHVLNDKQDLKDYQKIESLRKQLLQDKTMITVDDFGAGSAIDQSNQRSISDIARISGSRAKKGQLLFRIANYYHPKTMIELGTSLGLSAVYLASGNKNAKLITMEGSLTIAGIAEKIFQKTGLKNIELVRGDFDDILSSVINKYDSEIDLAYIDGNHRKEPTLKYFNMLIAAMTDSSVIILDDIHWSSDMEEAWSEIKNDPRILLTIDLFFIGLIFFRKDFKIKQHFDIRYRV
jgi:predicted O-methyltransferase YrrM